MKTIHFPIRSLPIISRNSFDKFANIVSQNLTTNDFQNEDTIRYLFFDFMKAELRLNVNNIYLELPFDNGKLFSTKHNIASDILSKLYLDAFKINDKECYAVKFKFNRNRKRSNKYNHPRTYNLGRLLNNLNRLHILSTHPDLKKLYKYDIYVLDNKMAEYYKNKNNGFNDTLYIHSENTPISLSETIIKNWNDSDTLNTNIKHSLKAFIKGILPF